MFHNISRIFADQVFCLLVTHIHSMNMQGKIFMLADDGWLGS